MTLTFLTGKAFLLPTILQFPFALINNLSVQMCKFVPALEVWKSIWLYNQTRKKLSLDKTLHIHKASSAKHDDIYLSLARAFLTIKANHMMIQNQNWTYCDKQTRDFSS